MRQTGFTLMEALATLAVLVCVFGLAAPAAQDAIQEARLSALTGDLLQHLRLARSEALKRNARVALCRSADGLTCAEAGGWHQGWILFEDSNNSGLRDAEEPLLQRVDRLPPDLRLTGNGPVDRYVSYDAFGMTRLTSGAFQAGSFTLCRVSAGVIEARQIIVNAGGRPRVQKVLVASCI